MKAHTSHMKLPVSLLIVLLMHLPVYGQNPGIPQNRKATVFLNDSTKCNGPVLFEDDSIIVVQTGNGTTQRFNKLSIQRIEYETYKQVNYSIAIPAEVVFKDGNIIRGVVRKEDATTITFYSDITGERILDREKILHIKYMSNIKSGNNLVYINLASRYFFSPSAIQMKKGDGYYQNTYFLFNSFNYAFTDNISAGGGFETISLLNGKPVYFLQLKTGLEVARNFHVGGGIMHLNFSLMTESDSYFNLAFVTTTVGNSDYNFSVNYGFEPGGNSNEPLLTFNGFARISPKIGFVTENWVFPATDDRALFSYGCRIIGRKNLFDAGIITNNAIMEDGIIGIPFLSYTLRF